VTVARAADPGPSAKRGEFAASVTIRIAAIALGLLVNVMLARALGPAEFGAYAFVLGVVVLLATPLHSGLAALMTRDIARDAALGAWARVRGLLRFANGLVVAAAVVVTLIGALMVWALRPERAEAWWWAGALLPLYCLASLRGAALRGVQRALLGQLPDAVIRPALLAAILAAAMIAGHAVADAASAMRAHVAAAAAAFVVGLVLLVRALPTAIGTVAPIYETAGWLRAIVPFTAIAGIQVANGSIATLALGILGTEVALGHYRVAELGASLVAIGIRAGDMLLAPRVAALHANGDRVALQDVVTRTSRAMFAAAAAVALVEWAAGDWLLAVLFGEPYRPARIALYVLVAAQLANAACGPVGVLMNMTGHERESVRAVGAGAAVLLVASLVLVPRYGAVGTACASALSIVTWNVLLARRARVLLGIRSTPW
jgi:O-antigen/teichoic acid export membrane protein